MIMFSGSKNLIIPNMSSSTHLLDDDTKSIIGPKDIEYRSGGKGYIHFTDELIAIETVLGISEQELRKKVGDNPVKNRKLKLI